MPDRGHNETAGGESEDADEQLSVSRSVRPSSSCCRCKERGGRDPLRRQRPDGAKRLTPVEGYNPKTLGGVLDRRRSRKKMKNLFRDNRRENKSDNRAVRTSQDKQKGQKKRAPQYAEYASKHHGKHPPTEDRKTLPRAPILRQHNPNRVLIESAHIRSSPRPPHTSALHLVHHNSDSDGVRHRVPGSPCLLFVFFSGRPQSSAP